MVRTRGPNVAGACTVADRPLGRVIGRPTAPVALAEGSLTNVDKVLKTLRMKSRRLEAEIREIVRSQTDAGEQGKHELNEARRSIQELFTKIEQIKTKAEQSEEMVREITSGIKSLDYAKRHLTVSITTLRRLNMLGAWVCYA